MSSHPAGWYPDPFGRFEHRYFNGSMWTADVSNGGERMVDPIGAASPVRGAYQPVAADASAAARRGNGMGITAMILGIVAVTTAWIPFAFVAGALCGVLAIIFGIVARRRRKGRGGSPSGTVGLILGPVALLFAVGGVALTWVVLDVIRPGRYEYRVDELRGRRRPPGVPGRDPQRHRPHPQLHDPRRVRPLRHEQRAGHRVDRRPRRARWRLGAVDGQRPQQLRHRPRVPGLVRRRHLRLPRLMQGDVPGGIRLGVLGDRADAVLRAPRRRLGPPWSKDHRTALAATIAA